MLSLRSLATTSSNRMGCAFTIGKKGYPKLGMTGVQQWDTGMMPGICAIQILYQIVVRNSLGGFKDLCGCTSRIASARCFS